MINLSICAFSEWIQIFANGSLNQEGALRNECNRCAQNMQASCLGVDPIDQDSASLQLN